jgi:hypothetical protein
MKKKNDQFFLQGVYLIALFVLCGLSPAIANCRHLKPTGDGYCITPGQEKTDDASTEWHFNNGCEKRITVCAYNRLGRRICDGIALGDGHITCTRFGSTPSCPFQGGWFEVGCDNESGGMKPTQQLPQRQISHGSGGGGGGTPAEGPGSPGWTREKYESGRSSGRGNNGYSSPDICAAWRAALTSASGQLDSCNGQCNAVFTGALARARSDADRNNALRIANSCTASCYQQQNRSNRLNASRIGVRRCPPAQ